VLTRRGNGFKQRDTAQGWVQKRLAAPPEEKMKVGPNSTEVKTAQSAD
jgi:hypothetical protein